MELMGFRELSIIRFVDATHIHPKVLQAVASGLFSAEPDLTIASLAFVGAIYQVCEGDLVDIRAPCVRKYGIGWGVVDQVVGEAEFAMVFEF
jgi:hypothetical protein